MSRRESLTKTFLPLLLIALLAGCAQGPDRRKTDAFFIDWLKSHGETNIVVDARGVGLAGNPTRLRSSLYGMKTEHDGDYTAEMEFRILLPSKAEIIEFVIGMGKTQEAAIKDSELNFLLTSFHVIYRSFLNAADSHQMVHRVTLNGATRELMMGDIYIRGGDAKRKMDMDGLRSDIRTAICGLPLSPQPHWIKIVCGQAPGRALILSAALDNYEHESLASALKALKWPAPEKGYLLKLFIVVK
jgi:hypothetical protein